MTSLTRRRLAGETVTILAGFAAERKHTGKANRAGAEADFESAQIYARLAAGEDLEGIMAYLKWCGFLARRAVEENWTQIERFARRLADAGELRGPALRTTLSASCQPVHAHRGSRTKQQLPGGLVQVTLASASSPCRRLRLSSRRSRRRPRCR
jgi:hypothetical protein